MPGVLQCLGAGDAKAQGSKTSQAANTPLPPRRPSEFGAPPATPAERQPGPPAPTTGTDHPPDVVLDREMIRSCGAQWQKMKMDGSASGKSWREFSRECATGGPTPR
jgi:hypothetical protein